ncbi:MAG TPA: alpha/beta fold hydrolase [Edaphobacter sp.]|nr:alpha/beta fold hydrolase [Edaphobacter sp.]
MPRPSAKPPKRTPQPASEPITVEPMWLVKAMGATILVALICAYLVLCLLFYQGQWQLVLHPKRTKAAPQSIAGAPYEIIHFGPDATAIPQLTGWWIPAEHANQYGGATVLFLPAGDGSLQDSVSTLAALHNLGINVFAFDYRGYGQSANTHPTQQRMIWDTDAAWSYLTDSRSITAKELIVYGAGVGASLAAHLAEKHPQISGVILDDPHADLLDVARNDPRSNLIPLNALFHDRFPLAEPLAKLQTPKLLIARSDTAEKMQAAFRAASSPKTTITIQSAADERYQSAVSAFLESCLHASQAHQK